jgi:hypothetical protein
MEVLMKKGTASVTTQYISTLALIVNPAPVKGEGSDESAHTRDNTPWAIVLPELGVSVLARDRKGELVYGYWDDKEAQHSAEMLYQHLRSHPDLLANAQANPEFPGTVSEYGKVMYRVLTVIA